MSGSEFERENIVTDALSAAAASKPAEPDRANTAGGRRPRVFTIPALEKDSCGVGFIANIKGKKSHQIVSDAISILCNLEHRGAVGADPRAGDGAGILVQIPHAFFARKASRARLRAAAARRLRGRRAVHAEGNGLAQSHQEHHRRPDQGRGADAARLARRADRQFLARRNRQADRACHTCRCSSAAARTSRPRRSSSAGSTSCASRFRRRSISAATAASPAITRRRCRAAPSSTRACSSPTSSATTIPTCTSPISRARWRWCISASRPTPSRPGRWRTPTGWSRITARSTRCAATSTGWRRGRPRCIRSFTARTSAGCGRSPMKARATPPASTTASNSWCRAATRCRTPS